MQLTRPAWTFEDLLLPDAVTRTLREILIEIRGASALRAHGLWPRNHLLFVGPAGCGKTATASALAAELGVPVLRADLSALVSSFLGETAKNIAEVFDYARATSCVLLFDEVDAIAKERADRSDHGEFKRVVVAFLQLLESFRGTTPVVAATNHPAMLDDALWRRFDDIIFFERPTASEIPRLIELKLRTIRHRLTGTQGRNMRGFSHAEVEQACQNAMRHAIVSGRELVTTRDLADAAAEIGERKRRLRAYSQS